MKKIILLIFLLIPLSVNAIFIPPVHRKEEIPQNPSCYMQEKQSEGLWKCYTLEQWQEKGRIEAEQERIEKENSRKFWASEKGQKQESLNWILLIFWITLTLISAGIHSKESYFSSFGDLSMMYGLVYGFIFGGIAFIYFIV